MLFPDDLAVLRGGGDLGSGVAYRLVRGGFPVVVLELAEPLTVRRTVAFSTAVTEGTVRVEGVQGRLVRSQEEAVTVAATGVVAVLVAPELPEMSLSAVVDARMAKRNLGTSLSDAATVIGLGPGFDAGVDCHAVVETARGHHLGRVIEEGSALPNTGIPGAVGGRTADRVVRSPGTGTVGWDVEIGDLVSEGQVIGRVGAATVVAGVAGAVRGLLAPGHDVTEGFKIGDVDPRGDPAACFEISDKALAVGGGVVEVVLSRLNQR